MKVILYSVLALCCLSFAAQAEPISDIKDMIQNKSFWHEHFPERYFFGADGAFLLQYTAGTDQYVAGTVREGTWDIGESDRLCWAFKDEGINRCYDVSEDLLAVRPWYNFDNTYELKEVGRPANILWNRWMHGNLIAKPYIYKTISDGKIPALDEHAYKKAIGDKVMRLPLAYVYHRADGRAFLMNESMAKKIESNPSTIDAIEKDKNIKARGWAIENNRHCYDQGTDKANCMTVFSAQDLYVPQEGWVQIMDDNFIRLIKPSDLIAVK